MDKPFLNTVKKSLVGSIIAAGFLVPAAVAAQDVTLRSTDGTINVNGELVDVVDGSYIIRTALGELSIATSRVSCEGDACPTFEGAGDADVVIAGSSSIGQRLMPLLMRGYASSLDADAEIVNPSADETVATLIADGGFGDEMGSFSITSVGDAAGFQALLDGPAQVGMSSRRILVDEARALRAAGSESMVGQEQEKIIALDSMIVIAHESNPVDALTREQLASIFSGEIDNWSQVGGEDKPINVVTYYDDTTNYDFFMGYLYDEDVPEFLPAAVVDDDQEMANVVFLDKYSIGYLGFAFQRGTHPITLINECGIPMVPDDFAAKTEEYTLSRRMYLYNRGDNVSDAARDFLNFASSEEANEIILKSGFIDLGITSRPQGNGDARRGTLEELISSTYGSFETQVMEEMLELMDDYDRLSTTIHFRPGSSRVDERGDEDMRRLVDYLQNEAPAGATITFVGFTDDQGAFSANQELAAERAEQIKDHILELAGGDIPGLAFNTTGFGSIAPAACNETEQGRHINRRVEVWISNDN